MAPSIPRSVPMLCASATRSVKTAISASARSGLGEALRRNMVTLILDLRRYELLLRTTTRVRDRRQQRIALHGRTHSEVRSPQ